MPRTAARTGRRPARSGLARSWRAPSATTTTALTRRSCSVPTSLRVMSTPSTGSPYRRTTTRCASHVTLPPRPVSPTRRRRAPLPATRSTARGERPTPLHPERTDRVCAHECRHVWPASLHRRRLQELPRRARHGRPLRRAGQTYTPSSFGACFTCHDGRCRRLQHQAYFPTTVGGTNAGTRAGHKTTTPGVLPAGSAMPCYYCHNPHGSASTYGLQVITMSGGTTITVGDTAGEIDMTATPAPASVREFCFTCHTTSDTGAGWNGTTMAVTDASDSVAGIPRFTAGRPPAPADRERARQRRHRELLHLSRPRLLDRHEQQRPQPVRRCVHRRWALLQLPHHVQGPDGGRQRLQRRRARRLLPPRPGRQHVGPTTTATWREHRHVPVPSNAAIDSVFCVSCHVDHDKFNAAKGANLRERSRRPRPPTPTSRNAPTAYVRAATRRRFRANEQPVGVSERSDANAEVSGPLPRPAHQYSVNSSFARLPATCSRGLREVPQRRADEELPNVVDLQFGTHWSGNRILSALGGASIGAADPGGPAQSSGPL